MEEMLEMTLLEGEEKMTKCLEAYHHELTTVRTGRANPALLDTVQIDYYGVPTPVKQVASITIPEANQLYIKPYDKSVIKTIESAIYASQLGLTPQSDSNGIRLVLPQMTEERRKELVKNVGKMEETAKVGVRNVRRDLNDAVKKLELPEDTETGALEEVQKMTDSYIKKIEEATAEKSKDLLTI